MGLEAVETSPLIGKLLPNETGFLSNHYPPQEQHLFSTPREGYIHNQYINSTENPPNEMYATAVGGGRGWQREYIIKYIKGWQLSSVDGNGGGGHVGWRG